MRGFLLPVLLLLVPSAGAQSVAGATPGSFRVAESGAAQYRIPIRVPPGTGAMQPRLALAYSSHAGDGFLGVGWNVEGLSEVTRCPGTIAQDGMRGGVSYEWSDRYCLDGQRLIAVSGSYGADGTEYRTERETFTKVVSYGAAGNGPAWFEAWTKSGEVLEYGNTLDSGIEAQGKPTVRTWALNRITDATGNHLAVTYAEDNANGDFYPARIDFSGHSVRFVYQARADDFASYTAGSVVRQRKLLSRLQTYLAESMVTEYVVTYEPGTLTGRSRIQQIVECAAAGACRSPIALGWQDGARLFASGFTQDHGGNWVTHQWALGDFDGDGKADLIVANEHNDYYVSLSTGSAFLTSLWQDHGGSLSDHRWKLGDFNGDGKTDLIMQNSHNDFVVALSTGTAFGPIFVQDHGGNWLTHQWEPGDFNGDGKADLIVANEHNDYYVSLSTGSAFVTSLWQDHGGSLSDHRWKLGDFNGDGKTDLIIQNSNNDFIVTLSTGAAFGPIFVQDHGGNWLGHQWELGDFNGDGKTDLIVANEVNDYYVSLSTGAAFQTALWQDHGGSLSEHRWKLGDFNGDGKTDLIVQNSGNDFVVALSTGTAFGPIFVQDHGGNWLGHQWELGDFNGDGKTDLIVANEVNDYYVSLSTGAAFQTALWQDHGGPLSEHMWKLGDFNGDGKTDLIIQNSSNDFIVTPAHGAYPDLLVSIAGGVPAAVSVQHGPITAGAPLYTKDSGAVYPLLDVQVPLHVVSSYLQQDGIGGSLTVSHAYGGARVSADGRGMLGFRWLEATDQASGLKLRTEHRLDWPYVGLKSLVKKTRTSGAVLSQTLNTYGSTNPATGVYFPFVSQSVESGNDLNGVALPAVTTTMQYDAFGSATSITVGASDAHSKTTTNTYANDPVIWRLGRLTRSTLQSTSP